MNWLKEEFSNAPPKWKHIGERYVLIINKFHLKEYAYGVFDKHNGKVIYYQEHRSSLNEAATVQLLQSKLEIELNRLMEQTQGELA